MERDGSRISGDHEILICCAVPKYWLLLHTVKPDNVIQIGWGTFANQSAIGAEPQPATTKHSNDCAVDQGQGCIGDTHAIHCAINRIIMVAQVRYVRITLGLGSER